MIRSYYRAPFLLATFVSILLSLADARAASLKVGLLSLTPAGAKVRVDYFPGIMSCFGNPCTQSYVTATISPCPPGKSCAGNEYQTVVTGPLSPYIFQLDVDLALGEVYTFAGLFHCTSPCATTSPIAPVEYVVPDLPTWDVSFVSANLDTVFIDLKIVGSNWTQTPCYASGSPGCIPFQRMRWVITPCPLMFAGSTNYNDFCSDGTFDFSPPFSDNVPIRVALRAGLTYTFSGRVATSAVKRSHDGSCDNVNCTVVEEPAPKTYVAEPVATMPATWGKVKSLYRSP